MTTEVQERPVDIERLVQAAHVVTAPPFARGREVAEELADGIEDPLKRTVATGVLAVTAISGSIGLASVTGTESHQRPTTGSVVVESTRALGVAIDQAQAATTSRDGASMTDAEILASYKVSDYATAMARSEGPAGILLKADIPAGTSLDTIAVVAKAQNPGLDVEDFVDGAVVVNKGQLPAGGNATSLPIVEEQDGEVLVLAGLTAPAVNRLKQGLQEINKVPEAPTAGAPGPIPSEIPGLISPSNIGQLRVDGYHEMPEAPNGEYRFQENKPELHCGSKALIDVNYTVAVKWNELHPDPEDQLEIGDLNGAVGHASHKHGNDVDLYTASETAFNMYTGDNEKSKELARLYADTNQVEVMFYNDQEVIDDFNAYVKEHGLSGRMEAWPNHDKHAHLRVKKEYALPLALNCSPDLPKPIGNGLSPEKKAIIASLPLEQDKKDNLEAAVINAMQVATEQPVNPTVQVGQWATESGWGRNAPGNNNFGMKVDGMWNGATQVIRTFEYVNGRRVVLDAVFKAYPDAKASF